MALIVAAAVTAAAQQQQPTFKAGTQTVPLFATVTDAAGRLIPDLAKEDFEIFDNNKSQAVTLFVNDLQFIKVVVMLDESASMVNNIARVKEGAEQFLLRLLPDDRARIGSFEDKIIVSPEFTNNRNGHVRLCVQQRLARSVGVRPTEAKVGSLVAWIPGRKETEFLKRVDEAILGMVSESSGRNESERRVTSRVMNPRGRAHNRRAKAAWTAAR